MKNLNTLLGRRRQRELSAGFFTFDVVVKEVRVQECLQDTAKVNDPVVLVIWFRMCPVYPIQDIQRSVCSHEKDIVPRQVFDFAVAL